MTYYCTYCSAEKNYSDVPIPAIDLYDSTRIKDIYAKAKEAGVGFVILSGKYGLVEPELRIAYYDHLLLPEEVEAHANRVAIQLKQLNATKLVFYTAPLNTDANLEAYVNCIRIAAKSAGVTFELIEIV